MALRSGFYNAMNVGGVYDRRYNADDYKNVFAAFIKDGVRRSGGDDLRVTASGLVPSVKLGYAVCGGRWVHLDADFKMDAITPPVGDYSRIDAVVLRVDANENTRAASIVYRTGTPASSPQAPTKDTSTNITELILAHIRVAPSASAVTVTDTRPNANLCGWITTPVGYDDYFASLDSQFDTWFQNVRSTLASVTLFKQYKWRTVLTGAAKDVTFSIPQYSAGGVDIIQVYVNGLLETEGIDYTLSGSTITFITAGGGNGSKVAGTEIVVLCYKSIDGEGLGSVSDEITTLQNQVAKLSDTDEYVYICNGKTDNVELSKIAAAWLSGGTDYSSKVIRVYGTFGATAPYSGSGTASAPYNWIQAGTGGASNRRITFDFTGCSQMNIVCTANTYNVVFFGLNVDILGANVVATGEADITMFSRAAATVAHARDCRFWITANTGYIARGGTFKNCRCSLTTNDGDAFCFNVMSGGLLRLFGGEYYAYAATGGQSAVVYINSGQANAVCMTYGINCPTNARSGYVQTHAVNVLTNSAKCSFTDTVTTLEIAAAGQNIRGTIAHNLPGLM